MQQMKPEDGACAPGSGAGSADVREPEPGAPSLLVHNRDATSRDHPDFAQGNDLRIEPRNHNQMRKQSR